MAEQALKIAVQGAATIPLDELIPFQGDLKRLDREQYEQLRNNMMENGFSFTIHVWQSEGSNYIIDGHQRLTALKMMRENEGWIIPDLPVSIVSADDFAGAKRKILAGVSQYGKYTEKSLFEFVKANDIPFDNIVASFSFPDINMEKLSGMFVVPEVTDLPTVPQEHGLPESTIKSGSDGVKRVELFFDLEDYEEFMNNVNKLTSIYTTESITDTVVEAMREAVKTTR